MGKRRLFTTRSKLEALAELDGGTPRAEVCRKYEVHSDQLKQWEEQRERGDFDRDSTTDLRQLTDELTMLVGKLVIRQDKLEAKLLMLYRKKPIKPKPGNGSNSLSASEKGDQNEDQNED